MEENSIDTHRQLLVDSTAVIEYGGSLRAIGRALQMLFDQERTSQRNRPEQARLT